MVEHHVEAVTVQVRILLRPQLKPGYAFPCNEIVGGIFLSPLLFNNYFKRKLWTI